MIFPKKERFEERTTEVLTHPIGSGNIGDPKTSAPQRADKVIIPDAAVLPPHDAQDYHTGRGGAGNEYVGSESGSKKSDGEAGAKAPEAPISLADKLKGKLFGGFKKKGSSG